MHSEHALQIVLVGQRSIARGTAFMVIIGDGKVGPTEGTLRRARELEAEGRERRELRERCGGWAGLKIVCLLIQNAVAILHGYQVMMRSRGMGRSLDGRGIRKSKWRWGVTGGGVEYYMQA